MLELRDELQGYTGLPGHLHRLDVKTRTSRLRARVLTYSWQRNGQIEVTGTHQSNVRHFTYMRLRSFFVPLEPHEPDVGRGRRDLD